MSFGTRMPAFYRDGISLVVLVILTGNAWAQGVLKTLRETGARDVRINIVILAEGYTAGQQGAFDFDAANMISTLLTDPIYSSYRQFFNAYSIFVASNDSGADDPSTNTYVDTYFNSTFGSFGIARLFQGAHYHAKGWLRPQLNCKMRTLGTPFFKVCLAAAALSF